ncbi:hypothetical protein [Brevundimonas naejangsanensis]|uniref:hypothetical protein n=1 Tax=Brevundimonas naejangsanensis TaxID=588932 RepID=UPI0026F08082|nr:hypothetical protein [Brevundimonas naejangsanensis]
MRTPLLLAALLPLVGGCASLTADGLPVCDGQARRPANPYGSVLLPPAPPGLEQPVGHSTDPVEPPESHTDIATGGCA